MTGKNNYMKQLGSIKDYDDKSTFKNKVFMVKLSKVSRASI